MQETEEKHGCSEGTAKSWTVMETGELKVPIISYKGIKVPVL